jgi:hypothetical protein
LPYANTKTFLNRPRRLYHIALRLISNHWKDPCAAGAIVLALANLGAEMIKTLLLPETAYTVELVVVRIDAGTHDFASSDQGSRDTLLESINVEGVKYGEYRSRGDEDITSSYELPTDTVTVTDKTEKIETH